MRFSHLGIISQSALVHAFQTVAKDWRKIEPEPLELPDFPEKEETRGPGSKRTKSRHKALTAVS